MIRYIGAKNNLANWILEACPPSPTNWVEPFGGMFSIFFTLDLSLFPATRFIYNEINPHHLNLFNHLKDPSFRKILENEILNESNYQMSFDLYHQGGSIGALSWLRILCGSKDIRNILIPKYNGCYSWNNLINILNSKTEHFNRMEIENLNYDQCIEKWDQDGSFIYLDPPYLGYEEYYTYHNFSRKEHEKLRNLIFNIKSTWVLSYYKFEDLLDWYQEFQIDTKKANLGIEYRIKKKV